MGEADPIWRNQLEADTEARALHAVLEVAASYMMMPFITEELWQALNL